jgi:hypothetical protein
MSPVLTTCQRDVPTGPTFGVKVTYTSCFSDPQEGEKSYRLFSAKGNSKQEIYATDNVAAINNFLVNTNIPRLPHPTKPKLFLQFYSAQFPLSYFLLHHCWSF